MDPSSKNRARDLGLLLAVFVLAGAAGLETIGSGRWPEGGDEAVVRDDIAEGSPAFEALRAAEERIAPLHARLGPPQPGEWLATHPEAGQTFAAYRASEPNRPDARHTTIYLQPLGTFDAPQQKLLRATAELLGRFYGVPVKARAPISLDRIPERARRAHPTWGDAQVLAPYLLDLLQKERPDDAVAVLALTTADLWPGEGWNFVFGQASLVQRVGVWSLYRQGDPRADFTTCLRRTLKIAAHETGHMLGIRHCTASECCMNGSNHRAEADSRPLWFCAEDERKVWWSCKVDPAARYRLLAEFATAHRLAPEARFWQDSLAALEGPAESTKSEIRKKIEIGNPKSKPTSSHGPSSCSGNHGLEDRSPACRRGVRWLSHSHVFAFRWSRPQCLSLQAGSVSVERVGREAE